MLAQRESLAYSRNSGQRRRFIVLEFSSRDEGAEILIACNCDLTLAGDHDPVVAILLSSSSGWNNSAAMLTRTPGTAALDLCAPQHHDVQPIAADHM